MSNLVLLAPWPRFTLKEKNLLQLMRDNITVIPDGKPVNIHIAMRQNLTALQTSSSKRQISLTRHSC